MTKDPAGSLESFQTWLLRLVAQAVGSGEVPEALLTELQAEIEAAKERPQKEGHAAAIRQIADLAGVDLEQAAEVLVTMEAQPMVPRELLMRWIAEAWLEGQRRRGVFGGIQLRPQTSGLTFAIVSRRCLRLTPRSTWGLGRKP